MPEPKRRQFVLDVPLLVLVATALVGIVACVSLGSPIREAHALCLIAAALAFGLLARSGDDDEAALAAKRPATA